MVLVKTMWMCREVGFVMFNLMGPARFIAFFKKKKKSWIQVVMLLCSDSLAPIWWKTRIKGHTMQISRIQGSGKTWFSMKARAFIRSYDEPGFIRQYKKKEKKKKKETELVLINFVSSYDANSHAKWQWSPKLTWDRGSSMNQSQAVPMCTKSHLVNWTSNTCNFSAIKGARKLKFQQWQTWENWIS